MGNPDFLAFDLVEAFDQPGCPMCRTLALGEERWMRSFWREGKNAREARHAFYAGGGFCGHHAWLFHRMVGDTGAAIADLYGALADGDLFWIQRIETSRSRRRQRRRLGRGSRCCACLAAEEELSRKTYFIVELLVDGGGRRHYTNSDGLCFRHLTDVVEQMADSSGEVASFLLRDWRRRLKHVRYLLAEYDRKRDARYATEPKGEEQRSWTDVIRLYAGEAPSH